MKVHEAQATDSVAVPLRSEVGNSLRQVVLSYEPLIDSKWRVKMLRVRASPLPGRTLPSVADLYRDICSALTPSAKPILLRVDGEQDFAAVRKCPANYNLLIEIPGQVVRELDGGKVISGLRDARFRLVHQGLMPEALTSVLRSAFAFNIVEYSAATNKQSASKADIIKPASGVKRMLPAISGVNSLAQMKDLFAMGVTGCIGWPFSDPIDTRRFSTIAPSFAIITELLGQLNGEQDIATLECIVGQDPALAYRLLQMINSAAFGLQIEITSFRHCVMMLGYEKLKRWLSLLLSISSREGTSRPLMFASFLRGILLEKLVGAVDDERTRDNLFTLGVFSLIDRIFGKSFEQLFERLRVAPEIRSALLEDSGPYAPYLQIVRALEAGVDTDILERLDNSLLSVRESNEALLSTLAHPFFPVEAQAEQ